MKNPTRKIMERYLHNLDMERGFIELAEATGIPYQRLKKRINAPWDFKAFELKAIDDVLHFSDEDFVLLIRQI